MKRQIFHRALSFFICLSFLAASQIFAVHVSAAAGDSFTIGNISYHVLNGGTSVEVTADYDTGDITIPGAATDSRTGTTYTVTTIHDGTFWGHTGITSVRLPNTVSSIETDVFHDCTDLTSITMPQSNTTLGNYVFYNCQKLTSIDLTHVTSMGVNVFQKSGLESVVIPSAITALPNETFLDCRNLTSITLPDNMTEIGDYSLNDTGLAKVTLPANLTRIGNNAFQGSTELSAVDSSKCTAQISIGNCAFYGCTRLVAIDLSGVNALGDDVFQWSGLQSVIIPSAITALPADTFMDCQNLTSIRLPDTMTEIGDYSLNDTGLTKITLPSSLARIGDNAFQGSTSLSAITMPSGGTSRVSIGANAFYGCTSLTSVDLSHVSAMGDYAFANSGLMGVTVPASISVLPTAVFMGCSNLAGITLPDNMTAIGDYALNGTGLTAVTLPSGLTGIGTNAFQNSLKLTRVTIQDKIASIGYAAFYGCPALIEVTFTGENPPAFGTDIFTGDTALTGVYVPTGAVQKYRSSLPSSVNVFGKAVSSISMKTVPAKTEYVRGESLDLSGAVITVIYNNGDTADFPVASGMISGFDRNKIGVQRVNVSYGGFSTSFEVTVSEKDPDSKSFGNTSSNPATGSGGSSTDTSGAVPNPKTGSNSYPFIPLALFGTGSAAGLVIMRKHAKYRVKR